jgi:hypothetical protein
MSVSSPSIAPDGSFGGVAGSITSNSTFQNVQVRGSLYAKHASLQGDLRVNSFHSNYANIIMGSGGRLIEGDFVGGGTGSLLVYNGLALTAPLFATIGISGYQLEIQDGGEIVILDLSNDPLVGNVDPVTFKITLAAALKVPGMHHWSVAPKLTGAMQFDSGANKFVFTQLTNQGYHESAADNVVNGRLAVEAGAMISSVLADPADADNSDVPQFVLKNGAEKWRIALVTDALSGFVKLVIQRWVGLASGLTDSATNPWETVTDFQGTTNALGASLYGAGPPPTTFSA